MSARLDFNSAGPQFSARPRESIAELKARTDIIDVAGSYTALKKRKVGLYRGCCPLHNESTGSFDVDQYKQQFHCYGCGAHGDVIDLIAGVEGLDKVSAIKRLREMVGRDSDSSQPITKPRPVARPVPPPAPPARFQDSAERTWRDCQPITPGSPAAAYLATRGCRLPHPDGDLRWYDGIKHPCGYVGPALVALVTDVFTCEPMTLHRTWLRHDGGGKADIDHPRMLWSGLPKAGGVIRLWPDEEVTTGLCIAEGIETALTAARGFGLAWATVDAGNLAAFPVLPGVDCLTIVADHDQAGLAAAHACGQRWADADLEVRIWKAPTAKADLNDFARGAAA